MRPTIQFEWWIRHPTKEAAKLHVRQTMVHEVCGSLFAKKMESLSSWCGWQHIPDTVPSCSTRCSHRSARQVKYNVPRPRPHAGIGPTHKESKGGLATSSWLHSTVTTLYQQKMFTSSVASTLSTELAHLSGILVPCLAKAKCKIAIVAEMARR